MSIGNWTASHNGTVWHHINLHLYWISVNQVKLKVLLVSCMIVLVASLLHWVTTVSAVIVITCSFSFCDILRKSHTPYIDFSFKITLLSIVVCFVLHRCCISFLLTGLKNWLFTRIVACEMPIYSSVSIGCFICGPSFWIKASPFVFIITFVAGEEESSRVVLTAISRKVSIPHIKSKIRHFAPHRLDGIPLFLGPHANLSMSAWFNNSSRLQYTDRVWMMKLFRFLSAFKHICWRYNSLLSQTALRDVS